MTQYWRASNTRQQRLEAVALAATDGSAVRKDG